MPSSPCTCRGAPPCSRPRQLGLFPLALPSLDFYSIDLSLDQFSDSAQATYFVGLPITFFLKSNAVDELKTAAHTLLYQHPEFKKLMTDLGASSPSGK